MSTISDIYTSQLARDILKVAYDLVCVAVGCELECLRMRQLRHQGQGKVGMYSRQFSQDREIRKIRGRL